MSGPDPVAIIGGGVTGLTAAFRLQAGGVPVALYEAGPRTGGVIRTVRDGEWLVECGPNTLLETSPKITALIRELGLESRRWYSDPGAEKRYLVRGRRTIAMPGSQLGFFFTPLFTLGTKLNLIREPFLPPSPPEAEETLEQFVLRRLGREFLDYAINPFVAGVYAGDPARLSVREAFPKLHALEQKYGSLIKGQFLGARERKKTGEISKQDAKKISFDHGLEVFTDTLRDRIAPSIQLNCSISMLAQEGGAWRVADRNGQWIPRRHSAVLLAAPAFHLAGIQMVSDGAPMTLPLAELASVLYPPVASLALGFRREDIAHPLDGFGVLIPQVEGFNLLGTLFSSSLFPGRAPKGHVLLTSYAGGSRTPELARADEATLVDCALSDFKTLLGLKGQPVFVHRLVYPKAIPQYEVGYGRFRRLMDQVEGSNPGLYIAGPFRNGISLGDSIVGGCDVAARMAGDLPRLTGRPLPEPGASF